MGLIRQIIGVAALLVGALWIGQGLGLVRWPESSFMIDQSMWAVLGAILIALGLLLLFRRRRP